MTFMWSHMLWLLLLAPLLVYGYIIIQRRRQKYALRYASLSLLKEALGRGPGRRRHIPAILFLVGVAGMLVAVARPAATITLPSQQGTIILTLDVSGSMRADDIKPSRLEAAKQAALTFVEKQPSTVRIGVVSFSDMAAIVQAPTDDREAVNAAIKRLTTQRGTAIGRGILTSLDAIFEELGGKPAPISQDVLGAPKPPPVAKPVPRGSLLSAVVVLLSDGQSNSGPRPLEVIDQAAQRGVRIHTVGVGDPDGIVLRFDGRSIRVRLDEETLRSIAEKTDGSYFRADNEDDLRNVYESLSTEIVFKTELTELTAFFTAGAALILLVAGFLSLLWFHRLP